MRPLLVMITAALLARSAHAGVEGWPYVIDVPVDCAAYGTIPGGPTSPVAWDYVVSFGACIQDTTIVSVRTADDVDRLTARMQLALAPTLQFYSAALTEAPTRTTKLRAAYHIALSQVMLIVRARASVAGADAELRARLEPFLVAHARVAWEFFGGIERMNRLDPSLGRDPVGGLVVKSARDYAAMLQKAWHFDWSDGPLLASPP